MTPSLYLPSTDLLMLPNPYKSKKPLRKRYLSAPQNYAMQQCSSSECTRNFKEIFTATDLRNITNEQSVIKDGDFNPPVINHVPTFISSANENDSRDSIQLIRESKLNTAINNEISEYGKDNSQYTLTRLIKSDKDVTVWTGLASLEQLHAICISVKIIEDELYKEQHRMSAIDRVILTLTKLKQNISFAAIATLFGISPATVSQYFNHTIQVRIVSRHLKLNPTMFQSHGPI